MTKTRNTDKIDFQFIETLMPLVKMLVRYFRTELVGIENIPKKKGSMIISNHSLLGIDSIIMFAAMYEKTHRALRGMGEHFFFRNNSLSKYFKKLGMVDGTRANCIKLLEEGHSVLCYPAGIKESFSHYSNNYELHWKNRLGYLRCALAAGTPIIPTASIGADDAYVIYGHEPFLGRKLFGSKKYDLPLFFGLGLWPLPVKFRYVFDKPIYLKKRFGLNKSDAKAPERDLLPIHEKIWNQAQVLIDEELNKRPNRFF